MNLGDEANTAQSEPDLEGQRRLQRARLTTRLTQIFITWLLVSALAVAVALGGALKTSYTSTSNARIAFGLVMVILAFTLLVALYVFLAYSRKVRLLEEVPVTRGSRHGGDDSDRRFDEFLATTQLRATTTPPLASHLPEDLASPSTYQTFGGVNGSIDGVEGPLNAVTGNEDPGAHPHE